MGVPDLRKVCHRAFQAERDNMLRSSHHWAAVLTAVAIPVFTTQLEKSREATDLANIRAAYAQATAEALTADTATVTGAEFSTPIKQTTAGWDTPNPECGGVSLSALSVKTGDTVYVYVPCDGTTAIIGTTAHGTAVSGG